MSRDYMDLSYDDSVQIRRYGICVVREIYEDQREAIVLTPRGQEVTVSFDQIEDFWS